MDFKKLVLGGFIATLLFTSTVAAFDSHSLLRDSLKQYKIEEYLDSGWDFMGKRGEDLYFQLREGYAAGSILKTIEFDTKNIRNQLKMTEKALNDNDFIYGGMALGLGGAAWGTKAYSGLTTANKVKVLRFLVGNDTEMALKLLSRRK